jgi:RNA polymerase sigma factor (sigma-70 family)
MHGKPVSANRTSTAIAQLVRALGSQDGADRTDGQLLSQFLVRRDEAAFVALVRRHGPMVLAVCRRVLGNAADADDAFQATFLVLVRKARSLSTRAVLGDWLHGVARRTALSARRACALRRVKEQAMARPEVQDEAVPDAWLPILDDELRRLPENYRLPIVLCDLEGKTRREAAERLGWPEGTVAGRLARGRALLAQRLVRRGSAVSAAALVALLAQNAASAAVSEALLHATANAANLVTAGTSAATAVISTRVAALTEAVVRGLFLAKLKTATCALALAILVGLAGVALIPGGDRLPVAGAAAPQERGDTKPASDAQQLVRQLGSPDFDKRDAAQQALTKLGARAAAAVRAGTGDADLEIARRCRDIWPRLWQTEIARAHADRLAGYTHPLWVRFRKIAGDDISSRKLFAELVAELGRFEKLAAADADPAKAADIYAAELQERVAALNQGWREAAAAAGRMTGIFRPTSGYPTQVQFAALLFLGTFPSTAAVTYRGSGNRDSASHAMVFAAAQAQTPAMRRLFTAWLETRTDQGAIQIGLAGAVRSAFSELLPAARNHAAKAELNSGTRALAILVIGRLGGTEDFPLLKRAFADTRVWHTTRWSSGTGSERPIEVQVADTAVGVALWIYGQRAADFDFTIAQMLSNHPDTLDQYGMLGFFDNDARRAAHKKAAAWLDEHKNDKATRYRVKDWQVLFDGKTTKNWQIEGQVTIEDGLLKVGGDKGGSIVTTAGFGRGSLAFAYRQAGDAKTTLTWRGTGLAFSPARQGWTSQGHDSGGTGESPIRIVAPPGTTIWLREFAFRPY